MKKGEENGIFWSNIGSGFGEPEAHPHQEFLGVPPPGLIYFPIFTTIMTNYVYLKTSAISHKKIFKFSIFSPEPDQ